MADRPDLHGYAPDNSSVALLLIDFINDFQFKGAERVFPAALEAAKRAAVLRSRAKAAGVPVIYVNDNFGRWRSDLSKLLEHCLRDGARGKPIARLLHPANDDYFVLKPKHSGFHSTTLGVLLEHLGTRTVVATGVAGDFCVMFTAQDAYMRGYRVLVPGDCVASDNEADNRYALNHMAKVLKADVRDSSGIDFRDLESQGSSCL
jgi:nicotinamidase-related amidase